MAEEEQKLEPEGVPVRPVYSVAKLDDVIRVHLEVALSVFGWNRQRAAEALGIDRTTLYRMIRKHKLQEHPTPPATDEEMSLEDLLDQSSELQEESESGST